MSFWSGLFGGLGGILGGLFGRKSEKAAIAYRRYYDANRIGITVADAKRAGIHPLAALGANIPTTMGLPVSNAFGDSIGDAAAALGSILDRKDINIAKAQDAERRGLENDLLRAQIDAARSRTQIAKLRAGAIGGPHGGVQDSVLLVGPSGGTHRTSASTTQQEMEDQYGGLVGEVYGVGRFLTDSYQNWRNSGKKKPVIKSPRKHPHYRRSN